MPKTISPLTDQEIKSAKPTDKEYNLFDGNGLRLRVKPNGSKFWIFNYYRPHTTKRSNISLGRYPDVSLSIARKLTLEAKELLAQDIDPMEHKKRKQQEYDDIHVNTLLKVATDWFEIKKDEVTPDYADDIWRSLSRHIFPKVGNKPIKDINAPEIIKIMKPIEARGNLETIKRVAQRLNEIMNFAANCGLIYANPLTGIKAAFKKPKKQNMLTLKPDELPELMNKIAHASIKRTTRCLIEFQLHTMTRPGEASGAMWNEIDLEQKLWTIPAERMKCCREQQIPLTEPVLSLLEVMYPISGHTEFVFPSDRDPLKPCNSQTANVALGRMGFKGQLVSHGLRSLASTTLNEEGFNADLIEAALAHISGDATRNDYNHAQYLKRRIPMMEWWSEHIEKAAQGSLSLTGMKTTHMIGN